MFKYLVLASFWPIAVLSTLRLPTASRHFSVVLTCQAAFDACPNTYAIVYGEFLMESRRSLHRTTRYHVASSLRIGWAKCLLPLCVFMTCAGTNLHFTWSTRWQNLSRMTHKIRLWNYGCVNSVWSCHYIEREVRPAQPHVGLRTGSFCSKPVHYARRLWIWILVNIFYVSLSLSLLILWMLTTRLHDVLNVQVGL